MDFLCINDWETSLFPRFLSESDFKPKTRMTFRAGLRCFVAWCRSHQVEVPDTAALCQWKSFLLTRYQVATARTYLSAVKVFFRWLSNNGLGRDAAAPVKGIKAEKAFRKDCLSEAAMRRVLAWLGHRMRSGNDKSLRDFVMALLIVSCGLRVSEVSSLDVGDLDSLAGEPVIWIHGKGRDGKVDYVPVTPELEKLLFQYLEKRHVFSKDSPMFVSYGQNSFGKRLTSKSVSLIMKQAMVAVGLNSPRLTAHSLRHTAVTLALKGGATLQQVQQFARHRQIETTLRYAHNLEYVRNPCPRLVMKLIGRLGPSGIPI